MNNLKLFLDCDGVLADFDSRASEIFGMHPKQFEDQYGTKKFWKLLTEFENFYDTLPLMQDAMHLWESTKHYNPTILTGVPVGDWSQPQKVRWARRHFGHDVRIITCRSRMKRDYMVEDMHNVIIDDFDKWKHLWEEHGGYFIHHTSAEQSLEELDHLLTFLKSQDK